MRRFFFLLIVILIGFSIVHAQDATITVDATQNCRKVSPYLYGKNESLDKTPQFYKDAGVHFVRVGGGNNMSAYNWRKKMTVHPDWYNNVYIEDWDAYAMRISNDLPNIQGMFALQLLGRAASNTSNNFNDWAYNKSKWWSGVMQNLAGGGTANPVGGSIASKDGDIKLYSQEWPADSAVAILNHWFGANGLDLNSSQFSYWSMDNEPEIWNGTHDWAMPTLLSASSFMDRYISLAKKARAIFPGIKIAGPVTANEWQWYKWGSESLMIDGKYYSWLEYFIKRCADEEKLSGVRVLDVVDIHSYPEVKNGDMDALQLHRLYFDTTYDYPSANGVRTINGGWETSIKKEYILKRVNDWIDKYFGNNSGITYGISEWSPSTTEGNASATSVAYASHLGIFANNGVEYFSPWTWQTGMWETLHLFSRYAKDHSVKSVSTLENTVSAYATISGHADSMTVIVVNRDMISPRKVKININNFMVSDGNYATLQLSSLPQTETFVSHTCNALKSSSVAVVSNALNLSVPPLSITAVMISSMSTSVNAPISGSDVTSITVFNQMGQKISVSKVNCDVSALSKFDTSTLSNGVYFISTSNSEGVTARKIIVCK